MHAFLKIIFEDLGYIDFLQKMEALSKHLAVKTIIYSLEHYSAVLPFFSDYQNRKIKIHYSVQRFMKRNMKVLSKYNTVMLTKYFLHFLFLNEGI